MAEDNDSVIAAILAAGLLAREASNVAPGDQDRIPYAERADHAVELYRHCRRAIAKGE